MTPPPTRGLSEVLAFHPLLPLAWRVATTAGRFLRDERPEDLAVDTKSTPTDVVSEMDRAAEFWIVAEVLASRPDDGVLGEEGSERLGTSGVRWIIDPLDGTVNYLLGLPHWAVSVGVEVEGLPTLGVIDIPMSDESFIGVAGHGAWRVHHGTAEALAVREIADLSTALVSTGFSYDATTRTQQAATIGGLISHVRDIRSFGAATVDFCCVARGWTDAYFQRDLRPWDFAAGALIAQEAGAIVPGMGATDWSVFMMAATPGIAEELGRHLMPPPGIV